MEGNNIATVENTGTSSEMQYEKYKKFVEGEIFSLPLIFLMWNEICELLS
jgi:hypothetical protein